MSRQAIAPAALLQTWLERQLDRPGRAWLAEKQTLLQSDFSARALNMAISLVPRKLGKADLALTAADLAAAEAASAGWTPIGWSVDQAARLYLLLASGQGDSTLYESLEQLFVTADVAELIALYRGLPLYPGPALYRARAGEGLRSNMKAVFEAVAHLSPYPRENFNEAEWNQMVLKALFVGAALHPIQGFDDHCNAPLAEMLCDYAHERWAAKRTMSPELWRCVGRIADDEAHAALFEDLARAVGESNALERLGALLSIRDNPAAGSAQIYEAAADTDRQRIAAGVTWADLEADYLRLNI